jgi:Fic family protein
VGEVRGIRVTASTSAKEKRLTALLGEGRDESDARLREAVLDAQLLGSLELAGAAASWEHVAGSRSGGPAPREVLDLRRSQLAVPPAEPLTLEALLAWHAAVTGGEGRLRTAERERPGGPPPAPAAFVESRLRSLVEWLAAESSRELKPAQAGALALARIVEILPFDDANGRVARLAASHVMVRAGARPPVLVAGDRRRLEECLQAAFRLDTAPLCTLLEEASDRALDVMLHVLQGAAPPA